MVHPIHGTSQVQVSRWGQGVQQEPHLCSAGCDEDGQHAPWLFPGPVRIASARQFQNSITESVKVAVDHYIRERGLEGEFASHKYTIDHRHTGSHMWFPGFNRHPESLMSTEAMDVLWIEQAETIGSEMELIILQ